ncbi:ribose transport system ATP-binding protein, partial [Pelagibacterium halotolerans]
VAIESPGAAKALGFALVPEDRRRQGLVLEHSIEDNIALPVLERVSGRVFMRGSDLTRLAQRTIEELSIKTSSERLPANALSGGNQQKIVIGKWLAAAPDILIMDEPTAGIDIGSKTEIIQLVRRLAAEGRSIIFISSELAELLAVSDRIAVLDKGSVRRIVDRSELTREGTETAEPETEFQRAEHRLQLVLQERNSINV